MLSNDTSSNHQLERIVDPDKPNTVIWVCNECGYEIHVKGGEIETKTQGDPIWWHELPEGVHWSGEEIISREDVS